MNKEMIANKRIYVLSDTKRVTKYSNLPTVPKRNANYHVVPAFDSHNCLQYLKECTKHPYYVAGVSVSQLEKYVPVDTRIVIITTLYCSLHDKKEYIDYNLL
jgi:hypothetical protein